MKDYKRLTKRDKNGEVDVVGANIDLVYSLVPADEADALEASLNCLADFEDKIERQEMVSLNSVAKLLNNWFDSPCAYGLNNEFVAEYMFEKYGDWCEENCAKMMDCSTSCWEMFLKAKLKELRGGE